MITNIHKYIYDKLENNDNGLIENTNQRALHTIYDFLNEYEIGNRVIVKQLANSILYFKK